MEDRENGILGIVPGQFVAAALRQCPDLRTTTADVHRVTIDADHAGRVVITCRPSHKRRFWLAVRADRAED